MGVKIAVSKKAMNSPWFLFLENGHGTSLRPKKSVFWGFKFQSLNTLKSITGLVCCFETLYKVSSLQKVTNMVIWVPRCTYLAQKSM